MIDRAAEDVAVQAVEQVVLAREVDRELGIAQRERLARLAHLRARLRAHRADPLDDLGIGRRVVAEERDHLGDVRALVADALEVLDEVQQRRDDPQVAGDRRLAGEQRQHALVDLEVAPVDAVVVGDDDRRELGVAVREGLERRVEDPDDHVEPAERLLLEADELPLEVVRGRRPRGLSRPCR